eukprot:8453652-Pyramimonas_sp.AAC.1
MSVRLGGHSDLVQNCGGRQTLSRRDGPTLLTRRVKSVESRNDIIGTLLRLPPMCQPPPRRR